MTLRSGRRQILIGRVGVDVVPGLAEVAVDLVEGTVLPHDVQNVLDRRLTGVGSVGYGVVRAAERHARPLDGPGDEGTVGGEALVAVPGAAPAMMRASNPEAAEQRWHVALVVVVEPRQLYLRVWRLRENRVGEQRRRPAQRRGERDRYRVGRVIGGVAAAEALGGDGQHAVVAGADGDRCRVPAGRHIAVDV